MFGCRSHVNEFPRRLTIFAAGRRKLPVPSISPLYARSQTIPASRILHERFKGFEHVDSDLVLTVAELKTLAHK
jgi:hypothetical protein